MVPGFVLISIRLCAFVNNSNRKREPVSHSPERGKKQRHFLEHMTHVICFYVDSECISLVQIVPCHSCGPRIRFWTFCLELHNTENIAPSKSFDRTCARKPTRRSSLLESLESFSLIGFWVPSIYCWRFPSICLLVLLHIIDILRFCLQTLIWAWLLALCTKYDEVRRRPQELSNTSVITSAQAQA